MVRIIKILLIHLSSKLQSKSPHFPLSFRNKFKANKKSIESKNEDIICLKIKKGKAGKKGKSKKIINYSLISAGNSHIEIFQNEQTSWSPVANIPLNSPCICLRISRDWVGIFCEKRSSPSKKGCKFVNFLEFYKLDAQMNLETQISSTNKIFCETNCHFDFEVKIDKFTKSEDLIIFGVNPLIQNFSRKNNPLQWDLKNVSLEALQNPDNPPESTHSQKFIQTGSSHRVTALISSKNNDMFAIAFKNHSICVFKNLDQDPFRGNWEKTHFFENTHSNIVTCLDFKSKGRFLFSSSLDKSVVLLNLKTRVLEKAFFTSSPILDFAVRPGFDGLFCVTWDKDKTFKFDFSLGAGQGKKKNKKKANMSLEGLIKEANAQISGLQETMKKIIKKKKIKLDKKLKKTEFQEIMNDFIEDQTDLIESFKTVSRGLEEKYNPYENN